MKSQGGKGWALLVVTLVLFSSLISLIPILGNQISDQLIEQSDDRDILINLENSLASSSLNMTDVYFNITSSSGQFDGYNLFNLVQLSRTGGDLRLATLITDMDGAVIDVSDSLYPVRWINSTTIIGRKYASPESILYNYYTKETTYLPIAVHHELEYNDLTNTIFGLTRYYTTINSTLYRFDYINEYDLDGNVIWSVDVRDFVSHTQYCPFGDIYDGAADVTHTNSIFFDPDEDVLYVNVRNVNTFYKIDHSTGDVIWALGEYGNFTMFDINGNQKDSLFYHQHAVEKINENTYILFDNDLHNKTNPNNERSRIVEITIDETTMTANESWVWTAPHSYYSDSLGDADRLPNGNRLGTFGTPTHNDPTTIGARLVEIDNAGNIVWEMNFPETDISQYYVYRTERFRFSPILSNPADIQTTENNVTLSWDAWYNFRPKKNVSGNYELYLNGTMVSSGMIEYDKYWRAIDVSINVENLEVGYNNVTLAVYDDGGHRTTDTIGVTLSGYIVEHEGVDEIELGDLDNRYFTWYGTSTQTYSCNVTVNGSLYTSTTWDGSNITLDLQSFGLGNNEISIILYNSSGTVHEESIWVFVHPTENPVISPNQSGLIEIDFTDSLNLTWGIYDNSPSDWVILLNDSVDIEGDWFTKSYQVNYEFPMLPAGTYNVTLRAFDSLGQFSTSQLFVIVHPLTEPTIVSSPSNVTLEWGGPGTILRWEIYFANEWTLLRNGTILTGGVPIDNEVEFVIENWLEDNWQIGIYNLTLVITNSNTTAVSTIWVEISLTLVDPYADAFIASRSRSYFFGENAIDSPDGIYATIYSEYANGYLTLDMGLGEEIVDGAGDDFEVIVGVGGTYTVYVTDDIDIQFTMVGRMSGNNSIDLSSTGFSKVRYVRIEYFSDADIALDAIVAIHMNEQMSDTQAPIITEITDYWVLLDMNSTLLEWEVSDLTPWSYSIYVNNSLVVSEVWNGSNITFTLSPLLLGVWNVTLVVQDAFDNISTSMVLVNVIAEEPTTTPNTNGIPVPLLTLVITGGIVIAGVVMLLGYYLQRKKNPA